MAKPWETKGRIRLTATITSELADGSFWLFCYQHKKGAISKSQQPELFTAPQCVNESFVVILWIVHSTRFRLEQSLTQFA